jgi:hypothetical protein
MVQQSKSNTQGMSSVQYAMALVKELDPLSHNVESVMARAFKPNNTDNKLLELYVEVAEELEKHSSHARLAKVRVNIVNKLERL